MILNIFKSSHQVSCFLQVYRHEGPQPHRPAFFSLRAAKRLDQEPPELQGILSSNGDTWSTFRRAIQVHSSLQTCKQCSTIVQAPLMRRGATDQHLPRVAEVSGQFVSLLDTQIEAGSGAVPGLGDLVYR